MYGSRTEIGRADGCAPTSRGEAREIARVVEIFENLEIFGSGARNETWRANGSLFVEKNRFGSERGKQKSASFNTNVEIRESFVKMYCILVYKQ